MTSNAFGGRWTQEKLDALGKYLQFYVMALKDQPFKLVYIDSFAGTGRCRIRHGADGERIIDGSAKIALDCAPAFANYFFIEPKARHVAELNELVEGHPNGARAQVIRGKADDMLWPILKALDWRSTRGVLFLDPYGLQCTWKMVEQVADTYALDVFFLVSLSGLYRQAAVDANSVDETKAASLTRFLGTDEWRTALYTRQQGDLFGDPLVTRARGAEGMLQFTTTRLRTRFPYVSEPVLLGKANGAPLFALYFAVANRSAAALKLAGRVSMEILAGLR